MDFYLVRNDPPRLTQWSAGDPVLAKKQKTGMKHFLDALDTLCEAINAGFRIDHHRLATKENDNVGLHDLQEAGIDSAEEWVSFKRTTANLFAGVEDIGYAQFVELCNLVRGTL